MDTDPCNTICYSPSKLYTLRKFSLICHVGDQGSRFRDNSGFDISWSGCFSTGLLVPQHKRGKAILKAS